MTDRKASHPPGPATPNPSQYPGGLPTPGSNPSPFNTPVATYTLFSQASHGDLVVGDVGNYTLGMEFSLSQNVALTGIWFYSAPGAGALADYACGIWLVSGQTLVPSTQVGPGAGAVSYSGPAGSGWVKHSYDGSVTLLAGTNYRVAVAGVPAGNSWYSLTNNYWANAGPGAGGLTNGPITAPNNATSDVGQDSFLLNAWAYPTSVDPGGPNYWVDVEVRT